MFFDLQTNANAIYSSKRAVTLYFQLYFLFMLVNSKTITFFPAIVTSYDVQEEVMFPICYKDVIGRPEGTMTVRACVERGSGLENGPHLLKREESRSGMEPRSFCSPTYRLTARPDWIQLVRQANLFICFSCNFVRNWFSLFDHPSAKGKKNCL